jgi:transposase
MPGPRARRVHVAPPVRAELEAIAASPTAAHRDVVRARVVLLAAEGRGNAAIAAAVGVTERTVRKWRQRFALRSTVATLQDRSRGGRPARISVATRCEVIKLACARPEDNHASFHNYWTIGALRDAFEVETGVSLSESEIGRILRNADFRPHQMRLWLHSPDPEFRTKVARICDLYLTPPPGAHVVCVDEKTCIQALSRRYPTRRAVPGAPGRFEFEYKRNGTLTLLAAFDVRRGTVFGQCRERRTAADLREFMDALARRYPTGEVWIVWDNLNIHCGAAWQEFSAEHGGRFHFAYTPKHASWVNQVEIWFSILQRRVLALGDFANRDELAVRIDGFIAHWNLREAHPFRWTFRGRFVQDRRQMAA